MNKHTTPWLGLASYEEKHAHLFFGRGAEIKELFDDIVQNTQTVIYGPSGTGKTSIIRAGLFGLARKEKFLPVYVRLSHDSTERYSTQIIRGIKDELAAVGGEIENLMPPISETETSLWEFLHTNLFWSKENYSLVPLLAIDQFEEIFTLVRDKEKSAAFFEDLSDLCDNKMPAYIRHYLNENKIRSEYPDKINYRIVLSLREDYLARLEELASNIPALRRNRFSLQSVSVEQAMEIITEPGKDIVTEDVAREITKKVSRDNKIETSILSLFCNELNKKRLERNEDAITLALVNEFGDNIIVDFYEQVMCQVSSRTEEYLETVLLSDDGLHRNSAILKDALSRGIEQGELDLLQANRLIRIEERDGTKRIEFTHDVLCKPAKRRREKRDEDLRLEVLSNRFRRKQYLGVVTTILLCLVGAGFINDYFRTKTEYYADYVDRWGIPEGVIKLSKAQVSKRYAHYRFENSQRKLRRVVYANSAGTPIDHANTEHFNRPVIQVLSYVNDRLNDIELKNARNRTLSTHFYYGENFDRIDIKQNRAGEAGAVIASHVFIPGVYVEDNRSMMNVKRLVLKRDTNGYIVHKEFKLQNGNDVIPASDLSGICGFTYEVDDRGRIKEMRYLDRDGYIATDQTDVMGRKYEYDEHGNINHAEYFGKDEEPILNVSKWAVSVSTSDKNGNVFESSCFGADLKPCLNSDGIAKIKFEYNEFGYIKKYANFGVDDTFCTNVNNFALAEAQYDKFGRLVEQTNFGIDEKPCLNIFGFATMNAKYDGHGNMTNVIFWGVDGNVQTTAFGFSELTLKYNEQGKMKGVACFGVDGNPCLNSDAVARVAYEYDSHGYLINMAYFGVDGNPCLSDGFARMTWKYNGYGNVIENAYFGVDGEPCLCNDEYARVTWTYNDFGMLMDCVKYGITNEMVMITASYFHVLEGGAAYEKGLRGKMVALKIASWEFGNNMVDIPNPDMTPEVFNRNMKFVLMDEEGKIEQYSFIPQLMGVYAVTEEINGKEFHDIQNKYREWKAANNARKE